MLTNLFAALAITTSIGMTQPRTPPQKSGVITNEVSYQYETNEVNSLDDLIVGNIYHVVFKNNINSILNTLQEGLGLNDSVQGKTYNLNLTYDYNLIEDIAYIDENLAETTDYYENFHLFYTQSITYYTEIAKHDDTYTITTFYQGICIDFTLENYAKDADIVLTQDTLNVFTEYCDIFSDEEFEDINFFSKSTYLGNVIVENATETEGLYNTIENFIETYLYGNDKLQSTEYTIMGVTYTMSEWLAHTTTIVLISLIVFVLVMLIKWLFKQIGNTFNLVGAY